jgi:hypothetical protein
MQNHLKWFSKVPSLRLFSCDRRAFQLQSLHLQPLKPTRLLLRPPLQSSLENFYWTFQVPCLLSSGLTPRRHIVLHYQTLFQRVTKHGWRSCQLALVDDLKVHTYHHVVRSERECTCNDARKDKKRGVEYFRRT